MQHADDKISQRLKFEINLGDSCFISVLHFPGIIFTKTKKQNREGFPRGSEMLRA